MRSRIKGRVAIFLLLLPIQLFSQENSIVLSEVMFNPAGDDSEFIEITNVSESESFNLSNFKVKYHTLSEDIVITVSNDSLLLPKQTAVILEGDYDLESGLYASLIPDTALIFKIDDSAFGSGGMSNSSDRVVYLLNEAGSIVDSMLYSANNDDGYSEEKIILEEHYSAANWDNSVSFNGTPGYQNSITPFDHDLSISKAGFSAEQPYAGISLTFQAKIINEGLQSTGDFSIEIYKDTNLDSIAQDSEVIEGYSYSSLSPGDSITTSSELTDLREGELQVITKIVYESDQETSDNKVISSISVAPEPLNYNALVINEIMYDPSSEGAEWIELYNNFQDSINLKEWKLSDAASTEIIYSDSIFIKANDFLVISDDSSIIQNFEDVDNLLVSDLPSLNNSGDELVLSDSLNITIDSVNYNNGWGGGDGISLERINSLEPSNNQDNWGSSVDPSGATPSRLNSISTKNYDLEITDISILEGYGIIDSSVTISVEVKNIGENSVNSYSVDLFYDENKDSIAQSGELITSTNFGTLQSGDSSISQFQFSDYQIGKNLIIAEVLNPLDEFTFNNIAFTEFIGVKLNETRNDLIINEIMYAPNSPEPEWIEIYNRSSKIINLRNYKVADSKDTVTAIAEEILLNPSEYFVIADDSSIYQIYELNENVLISNIPSLNNSGDELLILDSLNRTIDSTDYNDTWGGSDGKSLERIDPGGSSPAEENWSESIAINGATPGFDNSVTKKDFDLMISKLNKLERYAVVDSFVTIEAQIKNIGRNSISTYSIKFYNDKNKDSLLMSSELFDEITNSNLASNDSVLIQTTFSDYTEGDNLIAAEVSFPNDQFSQNNRDYFKFNAIKFNEFPGDIIINEIMYDPESSEPEWIELYNLSSKIINLKNYRVADEGDTSIVIEENTSLNPADFFIIADDSTFLKVYDIEENVRIANFPALNNTGDAVSILDSVDRTIDSISYTDSWGGKDGKSLERIAYESESTSKENWGASKHPNGSTPGKENSLAPKDYDLMIDEINISENIAIVDSFITTSVKVKNIGALEVNEFKINLYYDRNMDSTKAETELIYEETITSLNSGDSIIVGTTFEDYDNGENLIIAEVLLPEDQFIYNNISYLSFRGVTINEEFGDLVINEIMYDPAKEEPEWIEIFNVSGKTINLKNYQIADSEDTSKVVEITNPINPGEYYVIADDSSFYLLYQGIDNLIVASFPSLNNSGDQLILLDSLNRVIDSLEFVGTWGGNDGYSLERIEPQGNSSDSANWATAITPERATPGKSNSVTQKEYDVASVEIITSPKFPLIGDSVEISARIANIGREDARFDLKIMLDNNLDSLSEQTLQTIENIDIQAGDTMLVSFDRRVKNLKDSLVVIVEAEFPTDQYLFNNKIYRIISPGVPKNSVVINEIMFLPASGEPEWVELYNNTDYSIDIKDWQISDVLTTQTSKVFIDSNYVLPPENYLVISNDSSIYGYHRTIPSDVIFSIIPNLNNKEDGVVIKDSRGLRIDSVFYQSDWQRSEGFSMERISVKAPSDNKNNWGVSRDIEQSSPGRINSQTEKTNDLMVIGISSLPKYPVNNESVNLTAQIYNNGAAKAEGVKIDFLSVNQNGKWNLFESTNVNNIYSRDTALTQTSNKLLIKDTTKIAVRVIYSKDEDTLNNYFITEIIPGWGSESMIITEFMNQPSNGNPEWIEIYNPSDTAVNIGSWSISDAKGAVRKSVITFRKKNIQPGDFAVISTDTSHGYFDNFEIEHLLQSQFGTLANEDGLLLFDFRDAVIDSINFDNTYHSKEGNSMEIIDVFNSTDEAENWSISLASEKATPGKPNSVWDLPNYQRGDFAINEIMYEPESDNAEFIELVNASDKTVNIGGWKIDDGENYIYRISDRMHFIEPGEFYVIASDSSIFESYPELEGKENLKIMNNNDLGLKNQEDEIILSSIKGELIDSLLYVDQWHNSNILETKNKSLERINFELNSNDPSNWSTCVSPLGGTPGKENSIFVINLPDETKLSIKPNPFSPDNDGFEDHCVINYNLTQKTAQIRIKIFDSKGRLVRTLANNEPSGASGSIIFDGNDNSGNALRIGIYILFLEALNSSSGMVETIKEPFVIARKL